MFDRLPLGIYWDKFWRLVDGCTPAGPECRGCWSAREANMRIYGAKHLLENGHWSGQVEAHVDRINQPLHAKKPRVWFVLNDLYHEHVHPAFIIHSYEVMSEAKQHIFIVCTKRPERIVPVLYGHEGHYYMGGGDYLPNVWHMTTAGNEEMADKRIPELLKLRQASAGWPVLGVSIEPMLGPVDINPWLRWTGKGSGLPSPLSTALESLKDIPGIDWIVLGGESGPGARPMLIQWARSIIQQCKAAGVHVFMKQLGKEVRHGDSEMNYLHTGVGTDQSEWPQDLRVRELPR